MIEIMMCSRHVPRQSSYFASYHSSKQGSNQRSSKRQNIIRSSSVQYSMLKRGIVADLLSHSMVSYYCICSNRQLRILQSCYACSKLRLRKGKQILERFHNKKKSSVAQTYTPNRHKGKNVNETSTKRLNDNKSGKS